MLRTKFSVSGLKESDTRLSLWLEIIVNFTDYVQNRRTELQAALITGFGFGFCPFFFAKLVCVSTYSQVFFFWFVAVFQTRLFQHSSQVLVLVFFPIFFAELVCVSHSCESREWLLTKLLHFNEKKHVAQGCARGNVDSTHSRTSPYVCKIVSAPMMHRRACVCGLVLMNVQGCRVVCGAAFGRCCCSTSRSKTVWCPASALTMQWTTRLCLTCWIAFSSRFDRPDPFPVHLAV